MDRLPRSTQDRQIRHDQHPDAGDVTARQSIDLTQHRCPLATIQIEDRLASSPDDMDVGRPMVAGIDYET